MKTTSGLIYNRKENFSRKCSMAAHTQCKRERHLYCKTDKILCDCECHGGKV